MPYKKDAGQEDSVYNIPTDSYNITQIIIDVKNQTVYGIYEDGQLESHRTLLFRGRTF
jgi:hypothetical protein